MPLTDAPCSPWPYLFPCAPEDVPNFDDYDAETIQLVEMAATEQLWWASGRRFGTCSVPLRPCAKSCWDTLPLDAGVDVAGGWPASPVNLGGGRWINLGCGCGSSSCSCTAVQRVDLLEVGPIAAVESITIDGVSLAVSGSGRTVRVDDGRYVTRVDGGSWPLCQDLNVDPPAVGAWEIVVAVGVEVPYTGRLAMGETILEVLKACGGQPCQLPTGAVTVTKRGVTIDLDPEKLTRLAGAFVRGVNPKGLRRAPTVASPDLPRHTRTTWP